jgi:hypothetical protein
VTKRHGTGEKICDFELKTPMLLDEAQAGAYTRPLFSST